MIYYQREKTTIPINEESGSYSLQLMQEVNILPDFLSLFRHVSRI